MDWARGAERYDMRLRERGEGEVRGCPGDKFFLKFYVLGFFASEMYDRVYWREKICNNLLRVVIKMEIVGACLSRVTENRSDD